MKIFQKIELAGEDVQSYTRSGMFYNDSDEVADVHDGAVVAVGGPIDHEIYAGIKDLNVRKLTAPAAVGDVVAFVDYVGINKVTTMGVQYFVGDSGILLLI